MENYIKYLWMYFYVFLKQQSTLVIFIRVLDLSVILQKIDSLEFCFFSRVDYCRSQWNIGLKNNKYLFHSINHSGEGRLLE